MQESTEYWCIECGKEVFHPENAIDMVSRWYEPLDDSNQGSYHPDTNAVRIVSKYILRRFEPLVDMNQY